MKNFWKLLGVLALMGSFAGLSHAAQTCARSDFLCFESGPTGNLSTPFRVDSGGNLSTTGNATVSGNESVTGGQTTSGITVYTPTTSINLSTQSTITPTATYMIISSTGGNVPLGLGTIPAIATATATNGQFLVLGSTSPNTITLSSSTASGMDLGSGTRLIGYGKRLGLVYDSLTSMWTELFYGSN